MKSDNDHPENSRLITLLGENNTVAWIFIYDKYAPVMYGNILNITRNKIIAEHIFIKAFTSLKNNSILFPQQCSIAVFLAVYVKKFTHQYLKNSVIL